MCQQSRDIQLDDIIPADDTDTLPGPAVKNRRGDSVVFG